MSTNTRQRKKEKHIRKKKEQNCKVTCRKYVPCKNGLHFHEFLNFFFSSLSQKILASRITFELAWNVFKMCVSKPHKMRSYCYTKAWEWGKMGSCFSWKYLQNLCWVNNILQYYVKWRLFKLEGKALEEVLWVICRSQRGKRQRVIFLSSWVSFPTNL